MSRFPFARHVALHSLVWLVSAGVAWAQTNQVDPPLPDGTAAGEAQIKSFRLPEGWKARLFAAEPKVASPIAIAVDERGRVFVAEEYRFNRGTEENRTRPFLLDDDLQIKTLEDRQKMFQKHADKFEGGLDWFRRITDRVQLLEDTSGDGTADKSTTFADGFCEPLDGLMAGVLARDGDIYITCIPHLWRLRDNDGDGKADVREKLLSGFGVNAAFLGHDLHGMVWGPDGKLYFSIGDRGYHVTTKEGTVVSDPRRGAVFRCEPDGSELEVVHRGLRNPQEIAFDAYGNLFAADNNCDKGDVARLVYIVEGGDSGWNMAFQTIAEPYLVGPWHAEKMWHVDEPERPAWVNPPSGAIGAGPSGFLYDPGVGLPEKFRGCFFMCNFAGGNSGIEAYRVRADGAGFKLAETLDFLKPIMATDAEFGYDGQLYVSDFVGLDWSGKSKGGRVYSVFSPAVIDSPSVRQTKEWFARGFDQPTDELVRRLSHPDMRVRQRSQFALAKQGDSSVPALSKLVASDAPLLPRLHALWGLGQLAKTKPALLGVMAARTSDPEIEIRAHAAKLLGDHKATKHAEELRKLLADDSPRVRYFALISLAKLKADGTADAILAMARANGGDGASRDLYLRHACVQSLYLLEDSQAIATAARDDDAEVRLVALLAQRKRRDGELVRFFADKDPQLVLEAARAIHDLAIDEGTDELAGLAGRLVNEPTLASDPLVRRVVAAQGRLGESANLNNTLDLLEKAALSTAMKREVLETLRDWQSPPPRDRVNGNWRPTERAINTAELRGRIHERFATILSAAEGDLGEVATAIVERWQLPIDNQAIASWANNANRPTGTRFAALALLAGRSRDVARDIAIKNLAEPGALAAATLGLMQRLDRARGDAAATQWLSPVNNKLPAAQRQAAVAWLGQSTNPDHVNQVSKLLERVEQGSAPVELTLDITETAAKSTDASIKARAENFAKSLAGKPPMERFAGVLDGGDVAQGRALFRGHARGQCVRCHKTPDGGGDAGPDLSKIGEKRDATYLLESLVLPDAKIAEGYGSVTLALDDGRVVAGLLKKESETTIEIQTPRGEKLEIKKSEIEERGPTKSAMPVMDSNLTPREMRDIVAYLRSLR